MGYHKFECYFHKKKTPEDVRSHLFNINAATRYDLKLLYCERDHSEI